MSARLKLIVAYDGALFAGWQSQVHGNTIQDQLENAFRRLTGKKLRVHGAGRTDAGVHALGQCAHVDLLDGTRPAVRWQAALNATLPPAIRILRCRYVACDFHARFLAKGKTYRYRVWAAPILPPLEFGRAWHVSAPLDLAAIRRCARLFVGTHDFAAFAAKHGKAETNTVRTIHSARVSKSGALITIEFRGNGFLYKMVRLIVGCIVRCGTGKVPLREVNEWIQSPRKRAVRLVAPAEGLFLVRIEY
jgi:tRNA pseudouridine38-40 synthase